MKPEAGVQQRVKGLMVAAGFKVWVVDQGGAAPSSRRDAGVSDIIAIHKRRGILIFFETKTDEGEKRHRRYKDRVIDASTSKSVAVQIRHAQAQEEFRQHVQALNGFNHTSSGSHGTYYAMGCSADAILLLQALGFLLGTAPHQPATRERKTAK